VKDILIALLIIAVVILVFGAVNQDQRIDFNYVAGTWHGASAFALAGIGAGVTLFAGLGVATVARLHVLGGRRKLEREVEQLYTRLRAAEAASPAAAEASRAAVRIQPVVTTVSTPAASRMDQSPPTPAQTDLAPALPEADVPQPLPVADVPPALPAETAPALDGGQTPPADQSPATPPTGSASAEMAGPEGADQS
jgi:uncharacterized integral membrane protein